MYLISHALRAAPFLQAAKPGKTWDEPGGLTTILLPANAARLRLHLRVPYRLYRTVSTRRREQIHCAARLALATGTLSGRVRCRLQPRAERWWHSWRKPRWTPFSLSVPAWRSLGGEQFIWCSSDMAKRKRNRGGMSAAVRARLTADGVHSRYLPGMHHTPSQLSNHGERLLFNALRCGAWHGNDRQRPRAFSHGDGWFLRHLSARQKALAVRRPAIPLLDSILPVGHLFAHIAHVGAAWYSRSQGGRSLPSWAAFGYQYLSAFPYAKPARSGDALGCSYTRGRLITPPHWQCDISCISSAYVY